MSLTSRRRVLCKVVVLSIPPRCVILSDEVAVATEESKDFFSRRRF